jgi:hypothetical protein
MTNITLFHEVGHQVRDAHPDLELSLIRSIEQYSQQSFDPPWKDYEGKARIEFLCDAFSCLTLIRQEDSFDDLGLRLRSIAFGFVVFACMTGLELSARATAAEYPHTSDLDVFHEVHADLPGANYVMGIDMFGIERARSAMQICVAIANGAGIDLFAEGVDFPVYREMVDQLPEFARGIVETFNPDQRGLCELLARALQSNPRGVDYLINRSKKFRMPSSMS